ncbi:hypothetical protein BKA82DRAFT_992910 [Pisolithus tinctorius]|uniref:Ribosomal protein S21 n=1 Tax=Pisolithus tinctorius Marx 270 TaxID=870435 RepID=A0A0C3JW66_PISTI|nr:hypothetical protein BKA82DRAFT_992910 [Pisolithus tinctorius]KIO13343.1 hypothetical protein M404DRAFT_992910 [Pisolithus tinctorius Marx 270]
MSLARQFTSTLLRNVLLSSSYWSSSCGILSQSPYTAQFGGRFMSTDPIRFAVQALRKAGQSKSKHLTPAEAWAQRSALLDLSPPADAYAGRRIPVNSDLRSAFLKLSRRLQKNSVFREWKSALRHEKRGIKRSRLRSERWRRRFADEVRKKVQLVSTIRRRA